MIKNLFFPEKIGSYFLFKKKIVGLHITATAVHLTSMTVQGKTRVIEESFSTLIASPNRITQALEASMARVKKFDTIIVTIDASVALFKELLLPIIGEEKIALVIGFELESYLPFPLQQANSDFIVTNIDPATTTSTVIVAAVQKKCVEETLQPFIENHLAVDAVSIDLINLHGFYQQCTVPSEETVAFVVADDTKTHIAYIQQNHLKRLRVIDSPINDAGWPTITFTLQSFFQENRFTKIVFFGPVAQETLSKTTALLNVPCELFDLEKGLEKGGISASSNVSLKEINILSLAAAYPSEITQEFNLLSQESKQAEESRFNASIITGIILNFVLLASLSVHTFLQVRKLSVAAETAKEKVIKDLKKGFTSIKSNSLKEVVKSADKELQKEETVWFPFSSQTRQSFLRDMLDLNTKIDRETLGLNLNKMIINKNSITLDGSVRNFEAIEEFERQLKETKLFVHVPELQLTTFNIVLPLATQGDRS